MLHRQAGILVNRANPDGVLLAASPATPEIATVTDTSPILHLIDLAALTMRASGVAAPALRFHEFDRRRFIGASGWQRINQRRVF